MEGVEGVKWSVTEAVGDARDAGARVVKEGAEGGAREHKGALEVVEL